MKKINKNQSTPPILKQYLLNNSNDTWDQFKGNNRNGHGEVKTTLITDQCGLCCYCEIDICNGDKSKGLDDFRVEHFIPKTPHSPPPNHSLTWTNLFACCTGGNQRDTYAPARFTSPDHSCDVPKDNINLDGIILNPLIDIPAYPNLFKYTRLGNDLGNINVALDQCPEPLKVKSGNTILKLQLNAQRLVTLRKGVIDELNRQLSEMAASTDFQSAMSTLAEIHLKKDDNENWPAFFSCIRDFFGNSAENYLKKINYDG